MPTNVQEQRLRRRFELWDRDNDGRIERSDWESEVERLLRAFNQPADSQKGQALRSAYLGMWDNLASQAGVKSGDSVDFEQFKNASGKQMLDQGKSGFEKVLRPTIQAILDLADTDGDGQVSREEFRTWIKVAGGDESKAEEAFRRLDTNNNGQLSVEELINAVHKFHSGELDVSLI
ncbi:EF-hand domain-containing protein [Streptomyces purpurogeneiscleroticus]|uniref:EF-hand domain-containing protein n=1 Tax=Streptomyces purpurogeneiscleroticus TaxID=68259 RepID=UPI001CBB3378|nr:EF-hand domain-containing protein [Streptomyces purpurogeneiscleroticus]MBZ4020224.1 signal transduction protein [Streptomyces purpurogeneiscleroticus]